MKTKKTNDQFARAERAAKFLLKKVKRSPKLALVLGSGLGAFADELTKPVRIPYSKIPGFPQSTAIGHAGRMVIGELAGVPLAVMQGRVHYYEGHAPQDVILPMRVFARMGVRAVVLTNAAGGINPELGQGSLAVLRDHINLMGFNPLLGPNDERFGERFFDMTYAYDPRFQQMALEEATALKIKAINGVYLAVSGPSYETPAEIRAFKAMGADLVGMSTVPEVIAARHLGIRVLAISCVTNMAAGISGQAINHQEVLETGERVRGQFAALLRALIPRMAAEVR